MTDGNIALILVVVAAALVVWFLKYKASSSERRMMRMLQRSGLNPDIADQGDTKIIMKEVRRRCRRCETEGQCERWLEGVQQGDNDFCPNANVFKELKQASVFGVGART